MSYVSRINPKEIIIGDDNYRDVARTTHVAGEPVSRGLIPRDRSIPTPFMSAWDVPLIPRDEWTERIEEMERTKSRLSDICRQGGVQVKQQDGLPYCWIFATVSAVETVRAMQGLPYVSLSPSSVGGPIKNYRKQGGWGTEGLRYIIEHGVVPTDLWPDCAVDRSLDNEQTQKARREFKVTEWYDLPTDSQAFDALMTCLLLRIPVSIGLNWWGHQVEALDPLVLAPNRYGTRIQNSWGTGWSDGGFGILNESKSTPDDACAPRVMLPKL